MLLAPSLRAGAARVSMHEHSLSPAASAMPCAMSAVNVLETDRIVARRLVLDDAPFILRLVNEPSWIEFIGDKGVRTLDDARDYIAKGPGAMYVKHGFGLYVVERKSDGLAIGMCGLIKRDALKDVDIGFAFLPEHWGQGYASESARAMLAHAKDDFGLTRLVAITTQHNGSSIKLLERIGFAFEGMIRFAEAEPEIRLYGRAL
jgi:ribosomal-protein-alanine N-acetyltransferase